MTENEVSFCREVSRNREKACLPGHFVGMNLHGWSYFVNVNVTIEVHSEVAGRVGAAC